MAKNPLRIEFRYAIKGWAFMETAAAIEFLNKVEGRLAPLNQHEQDFLSEIREMLHSRKQA